jgi:hypothetical protein
MTLRPPVTNITILVLGAIIAVTAAFFSKSHEFPGWSAATLLFMLAATDRPRSMTVTALATVASVLSIAVITGLAGSGFVSKTVSGIAMVGLAFLVVVMWLRRDPARATKDT